MAAETSRTVPVRPATAAKPLWRRVAATLWPWVKALRAAGKPVTAYNYEGANHAFNNDTSAERYNKDAADLAWGRTLRFFKRQLG